MYCTIEKYVLLQPYNEHLNTYTLLITFHTSSYLYRNGTSGLDVSLNVDIVYKPSECLFISILVFNILSSKRV